MRCERALAAIDAFLDGELPPGESAAVRTHLEGCPACARAAEQARRLRSLVAVAAASPAPPSLAARLRATLADAAADAAGDAGDAEWWGRMPVQGRRGSRWAGVWRRGRAAVAAAVVAGVLSAGATWWVTAAAERAGRVETELVAAHIRSLLQDSPVQVASSEGHTVKPWFAGRADFAPDVRDLAVHGFPLAGGRLDYLQDRRVGVVVYRRRLHVINLFMWPDSDTATTTPRLSTRNGYNLLGWRRNGIVYWAASDLNPGELLQFQGLL